MLTTEVILSFDPDAKSDEGRERAVRDGRRKIDANVEGWITMVETRQGAKVRKAE